MNVDTDVIIVGAGPVGLMLAGELRLAGVRVLVLERQSEPRDTPKANGLAGQIVRFLRYRGLLESFARAGTYIGAVPAFPFGGVRVDFTRLREPPLQALLLPQPRLEALLEERARELGAEIRRGHRVSGSSQDDGAVTADVRGPDGTHRVVARFLVGCDGANSTVRDAAGIGFPGTTYPELTRLGHVRMSESVTLLDNGDLDVPGVGRVRSGVTRTDHGVLTVASFTPEVLLVSTIEDHPVEHDAPMTPTELSDSIRRVLGAEIPLGEPIWLSRFAAQARNADRYRVGRILLAGDAAHVFPAGGAALDVGLLDTVDLAWKLAAEIHGWAQADLLDTYQTERGHVAARTLCRTRAQAALARRNDPDVEGLREVFAELLTDEQPSARIGAMLAGSDIRYPTAETGSHPLTGTLAPDLPLSAEHATTLAELARTARPILLDLADRADLRATARAWQPRIEIHAAHTESRPADALLIRPDARIAWAATVNETTDTATRALRHALRRWFGEPVTEAVQ